MSKLWRICFRGREGRFKARPLSQVLPQMRRLQPDVEREQLFRRQRRQDLLQILLRQPVNRIKEFNLFKLNHHGFDFRFGSKGKRAKSVGPIDSRKIPAPKDDVNACPKCNGRVFEAEKVI